MESDPIDSKLRYPGQYYDTESKLHYNHTRHFQPRTGRYLQPDLIGLEGGINVYTYAGGNPVMYMDPTGTVWDLIDIGFFFQSLFNFIQAPTLDNGVNLGLDTVGLAPGVPALGSIARVAKGVTQETAKVGELIATHGKTMSNKQLDKLTKNIRAEGIKEPLTVTEQQGKLYILDGHHRALAAPHAGISEVPINRVELPYGAYKTPADLTFTPGGY